MKLLKSYQVVSTLTALTVLGLATSHPAKAASLYSVTSLGGMYTSAVDINNSTEVLMSSYSRAGSQIFLNDTNNNKINLGQIPNGSFVKASSINDVNQVVGSAQFTRWGTNHAFFWDKGVTKDLGTLGGDTSNALGINNFGQVVGSAKTKSGLYHAFVWDKGAMKDLDTFGSISSSAASINNAGQVVGYYQLAGSNNMLQAPRAFLWANGSMSDLGTLGGESSNALSINNSGVVVGGSSNAGGANRPFLWANGVITDLLGSVASNGVSSAQGIAVDINDKGQAIANVQFGMNPAAPSSAFIWENGVMTKLNNRLTPEYSGWDIRSASAINNAGQIVAAGWLNGQYNAVVLTPIAETKDVPEPASTSAVLAFGVLGWTSLQKRKVKSNRKSQP